MNHEKFLFEFTDHGKTYLADICHYEDLRREEIGIHGVRENSFLIHLFSPSGVITFELFIEAGDMEMKWRTNAEFPVNPEILETIGKKIEDRSF